jgi:glycosyltransferase involved in cell wall biosynthesis
VNPKVSIIVPCRNEFPYLKNFLDSILRQDFPQNEFEIIVADGRSDDGTREFLEMYRADNYNLKIIDNGLKIVSTGLNKAIKIAQGEIIIRMDVHTEYAPDYIKQCVAALEQTRADNVGGPARTKAKGYIQKAVQLAYHAPFAVGGARFHDIHYEGYVDTVTYGCWKKSTLEEIGLFDEELVRNQDDELNLRIIRVGGKIWQSPKIMSWYHPRNSLSDLFGQYMQYGYWKVRVIQKHKIPASIRHLVPGAFVGALIVMSIFSPWSETLFQILKGLVAIYMSLNIFASFIACGKISNIRFLPIMPIVFSVYHFGYGYGFLRGLEDFVVLRKSGNQLFSGITRGRSSIQ